MVDQTLAVFGCEPYIQDMAEHTASSWGNSEWAAFWRQNGQTFVSKEPTIFTKTIRKHPWRDYSSLVADRMTLRSHLAQPGTLRVHSFEQAVSYEPAAIVLPARTTPAQAMLQALQMVAPDWTRNVGSPVTLVP